MPSTATADVVVTSPATGAATREMRCTGTWNVHAIADLERRLAAVPWPREGDIVVDGSGLSMLDTSGAWLLQRTLRELAAKGCNTRLQGLRPEFAALLQLLASRDIPLELPATAAPGALTRFGRHAWGGVTGSIDYFAFVGESFVAMLRVLRDPRRLRWRPILHNMQTAGVEALPITGLLSFLMGVVIAYQGADQLQRFGANIFVVDLVASRWCASCRRCSPPSSSPDARAPRTPRRSAR